MKHSAINLKKLVLECLQKYNIYPRHIYSVTSDNGSNLIKMVKIMDEE